ncbi:MAG TPA: ADOP family duplicated permease [Vicinamibacterales bacterium]|nr:ADOP family duplicated permease [Vicinamibacterales bacterium]
MSQFRDDLRWAVRHARRRPVFAGAVIVTLSVCLAAATTAFGAATAVLWRTLPFDAADTLVFVWEETDRDGQREASRVTGARYAAWRDTANGLASISLFGAAGFSVDGPDSRTTVRGVRVSPNYFSTLGIRPLVGRTFVPEEETPGRHRVVVLSHGFWQEQLGGRVDAVGDTLRLSGEPYTIVGVMPPVTFPAWPVNPALVTLHAESRQLWVPIPATPELAQSGRAHVFGVVARLAPGVSETEVVERLNRTSDPASVDPHRALLVPLREQFVMDARTPLVALAGAALGVFLIACANLAALYLSSFESRRQELAVRAALGAGIPRLVRQLVLETSLMGVAGAAGGLALAELALTRVPSVLPPSFPFLTMPSIDLRVAAFTLGLALLACLVIAAVPIVKVVIASSPRGVASRPRGTVYRVLVVSQVAAAFALVVAASLLGQSLQSVRRQDLGFALDRVFVADIGIEGGPGTSPGRIAAVEQRILASIAARPMVRAVATAYDHPLEANWSESPAISGEAGAPDERRPVELRIVSPGYFETLEVELLEGRTFTARDALDAPGVALINEALARELGGASLGRRVRSGTPRFTFGDSVPNEFEIVGVVANERFRGLEQPSHPAFYLSTRQFPQTSFSILVHTAGDPLAAAADIRTALRDVDPTITIGQPTSLAAILGGQLAPRRFTTDLIGGLGMAALTLAAFGMYGLLAVLVGSRTREIGVRLAIGASPSSVARHVVGDSLLNAALGIAAGLLLALGTGRLLESLLVGVSARDPLTLGAVAAVLLGAALAAALFPARRAARVDPVIALRAE